MTPARRIPAFLLTFVLLSLLTGCDSGRTTKVEVLSGPAPGKQIIRVASSDEAYVHFMKMAENYSLKSNVQFDVSQTQGKNILGLIEKKTVDLVLHFINTVTHRERRCAAPARRATEAYR